MIYKYQIDQLKIIDKALDLNIDWTSVEEFLLNMNHQFFEGVDLNGEL